MEKFHTENRAVDKVQGVFADLEERKKALEEIESLTGVTVTKALKIISK